jgi:hypothetical protein
MTHFSIHATDIDLATGIAVVTIGQWSAPSECRSGGQPINVRRMSYRAPTVSEATYAEVTSIANAHDWTESAGGSLYVASADGVVTPMPDQPSPHHLFDWASLQWLDPRTLQDLKDARWLAIKQLRTAAEFATFTYNAMEFDGDLNGQRRLGAYISVSKSALAAGTPFSAEFILADNALVTLTAQDFVAIEMVKVAAVAEAFAHAAALRAQIEAAETPEAVAAVGW